MLLPRPAQCLDGKTNPGHPMPRDHQPLSNPLFISLLSGSVLAACGGGTSPIEDTATVQEVVAPAATLSVRPKGGSTQEVLVTATDAGWVSIASEWQAFTVNGTQTVRFGSGTNWIEKSVTDSGACTNAFFGEDPLFGVVKHCEVDTSAPASTSDTWTAAATEGGSFSVSGTQTVRYG